MRGNHTLMFLSLSFYLLSPLSKNKYIKFFLNKKLIKKKKKKLRLEQACFSRLGSPRTTFGHIHMSYVVPEGYLRQRVSGGQVESEGPGGEAQTPLPSECVCQLPREDSGDGQAGELCNRGWEVQQGLSLIHI